MQNGKMTARECEERPHQHYVTITTEPPFPISCVARQLHQDLSIWRGDGCACVGIWEESFETVLLVSSPLSLPSPPLHPIILCFQLFFIVGMTGVIYLVLSRNYIYISNTLLH